jgi:hypothetical protein
VESVWVRSRHWELDNPRPGDDLSHDGIRISGSVQEPTRSEGVTRRENADDVAGAASDYVMTGWIVSAMDFQVDMGAGPEHGGTDVVLSMGGELVQARVQGPGFDLGSGCSRHRVRRG